MPTPNDLVGPVAHIVTALHPDICKRFQHYDYADRTVEIDRVESGRTTTTETFQVYEHGDAATVAVYDGSTSGTPDAAWWLPSTDVPEFVREMAGGGAFVVSYADSDHRDPETFEEA